MHGGRRRQGEEKISRRQNQGKGRKGDHSLSRLVSKAAARGIFLTAT